MAVIVAFAADLATTGAAFMLGAAEANPVMAGWSYWQIVAAKSAVLGGLLWAAWRPSRWGDAAAWYGLVATGGVSVWNVAQLVRFFLFTFGGA